MILKSMTLQNFKAIGDDPVTIEFKPITLLFGPNSAGKSTVIQGISYALYLLRDATSAEDSEEFADIVHSRDQSRKVSLRLEFDTCGQDLPQEDYLRLRSQGTRTGSPESLPLAEVEGPLLPDFSRVSPFFAELNVRSTALGSVSSYTVGALGQAIGRLQFGGSGSAGFFDYLNLEHPLFSLRGMAKVKRKLSKFIASCQPIIGGLSENPTLRSTLRSILPDLDDDSRLFGITNSLGPNNLPRTAVNVKLVRSHGEVCEDQLLDTFSTKLFVGCRQALMQILKDVSHVGPLRTIPGRNWRLPGNPSAASQISGEAAWIAVCKTPDLNAEVNTWLEKKLGAGCRVEIRIIREVDEHPIDELLARGELADDFLHRDEDGGYLDQFISLWHQTKRLIEMSPTRAAVKIVDEQTRLAISVDDVGVGISQVLPVIVQSVARDSGIVAIEQPELHLHPAMQVELGDLFLTQAKKKAGLRFLLETHSEHIILRLLRRVRETSEGTLPEGIPPVTPGDLAVYYLERVDGSTRSKKLEIDSLGEFLESWPRGFFEEREEELF